MGIAARLSTAPTNRPISSPTWPVQSGSETRCECESSCLTHPPRHSSESGGMEPEKASNTSNSQLGHYSETFDKFGMIRITRRHRKWRAPISLGVFVVLAILHSPCLLVQAAPSKLESTESTLDVLRDQSGSSPLEISERARRCGNITQLSCTLEELEATSVCGSDGRTYSSVCEIKKISCHGSPVQVIDRKGPCPAKKKCLLERAFQIDLSKRRNQTGIVIPECEADGTYSPVQCHKETGFCWCVTNTGRPIPTTSVQFKRPDCMPQGKVGRRSSRRRLGTRRRGCSTADRSTFSSNLMKIFRDEYEKETRNGKEETTETKVTSTSVVASQTKRVIEWKFDHLDGNGDGWISLKESADLRRMIRDRVQPKACARRFAKYCDLNSDRRISRTEWSICLGVDINMSFRLFQSLNTSDESHKRDGQADRGLPLDKDYEDEQDSRETPRNLQKNSGRRGSHQQPNQRRHASTLSRLNSEDSMALVQISRNMASSSSMSGFAFLKERPEKVDKEEQDDPTDCQLVRRRAQEQHQMNPDSGFYIPVCQAASARMFERIQCHDSSGFCWCVDPETGKPIRGTSKHLERPDCSTAAKSATQKELEIKGCTAKKKVDFLRKLHATLVSSMIASGHADTEDMPPLQRALRWKFDEMDKNKNKVLERKEWKPYRLELKTWKGMRKCGRNFLRSCDSNGDKRITLAEWLQCADVSVNKGVTPTPRPIRRGTNPFINILDPNQ